jgi:hypothetical protein
LPPPPPLASTLPPWDHHKYQTWLLSSYLLFNVFNQFLLFMILNSLIFLKQDICLESLGRESSSKIFSTWWKLKFDSLWLQSFSCCTGDYCLNVYSCYVIEILLHSM